MDIPPTQLPHRGLSLVRGSSTPELFQLTFGQLVDQQAARYGPTDAVLVGWTNARLSFQDLSLRTKELARGLLAMGVGKGDRIAILSGDDERVVELFFAAGRIGAVLVILNKTYTVNECMRALEHTGESFQGNREIFTYWSSKQYRPLHTIHCRCRQSPINSPHPRPTANPTTQPSTGSLGSMG
jgi:hypothetical protein